MPARLNFTPNLARRLACPGAEVAGTTVREALEDYFRGNPKARGYVLDDQGAVRKHVAIFVNRVLIRDRRKLTDAVANGDEIFVVQALSGG
jgi:sulfur carrier protein ThiS